MLNLKSNLLDGIKLDNKLPFDNESVEVLNLIKKYDLVQDINFLNTIESKYQSILDFTIHLYLNNQKIPDDINSFIKYTSSYQIFLLNYIQTRIEHIVEESSSFLFKDIYILLNLLSNGNTYELLTNENKLCHENIKNILNEYEDNICELYIKEDKNNYAIHFKFYLTLLELLNIVSLINSLDVQRRKRVNSLLNLSTSTITNLKNKISLPKEDEALLNKVLGEQLLFFTNITYVETNSISKEEITKKYLLMYKKLINAYNMFSKDENYYHIFLEKSSTLLLTLVYKLKTKLNLHALDINALTDLETIFTLYNENVKSFHKCTCEKLEEFQEHLLKNYNYVYKILENIQTSTSEDFLLYVSNKKQMTSIDMPLVYNTILYNDRIEQKVLDLLLSKLLSQEKFNNDYYEFYKLKIIDRIVQKYISLKIKTSSNPLLKEIIAYIEDNNTISHLMSMYIKVYLSMSLYHSYEKDNISQEKAKEYYFIYKKLDSDNLLESEFYYISRQIFFNLGKSKINLYDFKSEKKFLMDEYAIIGKELLDTFIKEKNLNKTNTKNIQIQKLLEEILLLKEPNESWLNVKVEKLIRKDLFFNLVDAKIKKLNEYEIKSKVGYGIYTQEIYEDYYLVLNYSSYYKILFEKILQDNITFFKLELKNIYHSYINSIPSYFDNTTKLPNMNKLKKVLFELEDKVEICFAEIYLDSLVQYSSYNNVNKSNDFFKLICDEVSNTYRSFRLFGPKIGIILNENQTHQELLEFFESLEILCNEENFPIETKISIVYGHSKSILEKSFYALSSAKQSQNGHFIYK